MQIRRPIASRTKVPLKGQKKPTHNPGFVQDSLEKLGGVAMAAFRVPGALMSGTIVGAHQGACIGHSSEHNVTPQSVSKGLVYVNLAEGLVKSTVAGYLLAGVTGAAIGLGQEAVMETADVFMFIKGGGANEMGGRVHSALTQSISPGGGLVGGAVKGLGVGAVSATKAGAVTGFSEGKGTIAGTFEAFAELDDELKLARSPQGNILRKIGGAVAGSVAAILSAPAGLALGLMKTTSSSEAPPSATKRKLVSAVSTAAAGIAAGAMGGVVGMAVGGVVGAVLGFVGPSSTEEFSETIGTSIQRAESNDTDLGHPVANKYRDIIQGTGVGALSGMRGGWDAFQAKAS